MHMFIPTLLSLLDFIPEPKTDEYLLRVIDPLIYIAAALEKGAGQAS